MKLSRLILFLSLLALFVYAWNAFYVRPMSDDYCLLGNGVYQGPLEATIEYYNTWSARYTAYYFGGVQGVLGGWSLIIVPVLLIIGLCSACAALVYELANWLGLKNPRAMALFAGVFLGLCFVDSISAEPIFWTAAMVSYGLGPLAFLLYVLSLIAVLKRPLAGISLWLASLVSGIALLIAAGFSETYIVFNGAFLGLFWLFAVFFLKGQLKWTSLIYASFGLLGLFLGAMLVFFAPGNMVRFSNTVDVEPVSIIDNLPFILWSLFAYPLIDRYGFAINFLIFFVTVFFLLWWYRDDTDTFLDSRLARLANKKVFWLSLLAFLLINSITTILPVLGTGYLVSRTWTLPRILQISMAVFWGALIAVQFVRQGTLKRVRRKMILNLTIRVISAILVIYPLVLIARNFAFGQEFAAFAEQWDARDAYIREAAQSQSTVVIQLLESNIEDKMNIELPGVEYNRANECMAIYYGVERIEVSEEAGD